MLKRKIMIVGTMMIVLALILSGCSSLKNKISDKVTSMITEKVTEKALGVDITDDGDGITVEGEDGGSFQTGDDLKWPKIMEDLLYY